MARWATLRRYDADDLPPFRKGEGDKPDRPAPDPYTQVIQIQEREGGPPPAPRISDDKVKAKYSHVRVSEDVQEGMHLDGKYGRVQSNGQVFGWSSEIEAARHRNLQKAIDANDNNPRRSA